ncbi:MAG TPA: DMT family transporter [Candidatus Limnocylindria bacterium]|nr:DMT family transporter [Candidatus Limnocylindria bacterium]
MQHSKHVRACVWLFAATAVWGLSFPFIKAILLVQENLVPGVPSIFLAALMAAVRFAVAGAVIALFSFRTLRHLTKLELQQGLGLGFFGGLGILFQMDALAHTTASTSAFLTQFYCLIIPIWVAWRQRALPKFAVAISSIMVLAGVAVLSHFDWREFKMGRGEAETILAAIFFAGQILWLERPRYTPNRVTHFTVVMFGAITVLVLPVAFFTAPHARVFLDAYSSREVLALIAVITFGCTLLAYMVMNVWQPHVTATEAGLIYCVEPIYASLFASFLPALLSHFARIDYPNEHITRHLLIGGGLITAANVLIQIEAMRQRWKAAGTERTNATADRRP